MCDPLTLASLASTAVGAVGTVGNAMGAIKAQKQQSQNVDVWQQKQKAFREAEQQRQEGMRQKATEAQQQGVQDLSAQSQQARQTAEAARLDSYLNDANATSETGTTPAPTSVADRELSGQSGGDANFTTDIAKKIAEASTGAKERVKALATISSYGSSFGGLGTQNPILQQAAGSAIDRQNEFRRGSLGAYNTERAIDPVQVSYTPSPLADLFSDALSFGTQGLGAGFGKSASWGSTSGDLFPKAPLAKKFIGAPKPLEAKYAYSGAF